MQRIKQSPGVILGVIAVVFALGGTAVAGIPSGGLKLSMFQDDSRDRLAGTGVIQYAAASHVTPATVADFNTVHRFEVKCELDKKATSGGFKWTGTPPNAGDWELVDSYPTSQGFVVRMQIAPGGTAEAKPLALYSNCVKSRSQRGTPPT
jgi:hypothetical protein